MASPMAHRVFSEPEYMYEIFMTVMNSCNLTSEEAKAHLEAIAHLRTKFEFCPKPIRRLAEFTRLAFPEGSRQIEGDSASVSSAAEMAQRASDTSPFSQLESACRDRFRRLSSVVCSASAHAFVGPVEHNFYFLKEEVLEQWPWKVHPTRSRYFPRLDRPVTRREHDRVTKAAWRLQLMWDFWDAFDSKLLDSGQRSSRDQAAAQKGLLWKVFAWYNLLGPSGMRSTESIQHESEELQTMGDWLSVGMPGTESLVEAKRLRLPGLREAIRCKGSGILSDDLTPADASVEPWEYKSRLLDPNATYGWVTFSALTKSTRSSFQFSPFKPFRRLGMAI
ncbi:hypothetical protein B0T14DRAFT_561374 [Immersiella caudata]|uniref:Uncharacterized protein n=1 Tax=Immersiella caudata TaxID=314043 RepID=A0AA40CD60_9PEZI|nr:hypothetical protein B0T14DRAFT_561374 [Immersiella caudata]